MSIAVEELTVTLTESSAGRKVTRKPKADGQRLRLSTSLTKLLREHVENPVCAALLSGPVTTKFADYISLRQGMLSFIPANRIENARKVKREWKIKDRPVGKPAKIARALIDPDHLPSIPQAAFEAFSNYIKAADPETIGELRLVTGDLIHFWYQLENYEASSFRSCMDLAGKAKLELYTNNPSVCALLTVINKNEKSIGRALVWTDVNGQKWSDRRYGTTAAIELMKSYADEMGWRDVYYTDNDCLIQFESVITRGWPYLDSIRNFDIATKRGSNLSTHGFGGYPQGYKEHGCWDCRKEYTGASIYTHLTIGETGVYCPECLPKHRCPSCAFETKARFEVERTCPSCGHSYWCAWCEALGDVPVVNGMCATHAAMTGNEREAVIGARIKVREDAVARFTAMRGVRVTGDSAFYRTEMVRKVFPGRSKRDDLERWSNMIRTAICRYEPEAVAHLLYSDLLILLQSVYLKACTAVTAWSREHPHASYSEVDRQYLEAADDALLGHLVESWLSRPQVEEQTNE